MAIFFHTRLNRNPLKVPFKFESMNIAYKSEFTFLGMYTFMCLFIYFYLFIYYKMCEIVEQTVWKCLLYL